jgi:hypothetical protein
MELQKINQNRQLALKFDMLPLRNNGLIFNILSSQGIQKHTSFFLTNTIFVKVSLVFN